QQLVRVVADLFAHVGVFLVQVPVGGAQGVEADFPCLLVLPTAGVAVGGAAPPGFLYLKLFKANGLGRVVILDARGIAVLVVPDMLGGLAFGEEQQVGFDAGVGVEHPIGQAHDGVQIALGEQLFLDAAFAAFAKQKAIGQHHGGATPVFE